VFPAAEHDAPSPKFAGPTDFPARVQITVSTQSAARSRHPGQVVPLRVRRLPSARVRRCEPGSTSVPGACAMCGICGAIGTAPETLLPAVRRMMRAMPHRGPDDEGFEQMPMGPNSRGGVAAFGFRRLAILDLSMAGHQPMVSPFTADCLVFNGEIYNYRALRDILQSRGHVFKTSSDSEVIVHAYEEWGDDCVAKFRGMFAFAVIDWHRRRILLARDQLGIKPLFFRLEASYLAFASEIPSLVLVDGVRPAVSPQAVDYFLRYRYVPAPHTIYQRILRLPPGHTWSCSLEGGEAELREYWTPPAFTGDDQDAGGGSLAEADHLERLDAVLGDSVRQHLQADTPCGVFLSGGVDSTLVAAWMRHLQPGRPLKAFAIGFEEESYSELRYAEVAARTLDLELHREVIRPDGVAIFTEILARHGEPFADTSVLPTWHVARLAREHVPVVLTGDGADEAFAGYGRYDRWLRDTLLHELRRVWSRPEAAWRRLLAEASGSDRGRLDRWEERYIGVFPGAQRSRLWRDDLAGVVDVPSSAFTNAHREATGWGPLQYAQHLDLRTYLPGDILAKVDLAGMAHGLEARTPCADIRVLEFARSLPTTQLRGCGPDGARTMKSLLKRSLARWFPAEFVYRPKQGFAIPETAWMRRGGTARGCLDDLVLSAGSPLRQWFRGEALESLLARFDATGQGATGLWSLAVLGLWLQSQPQSGQPGAYSSATVVRLPQPGPRREEMAA